MFSVPQYNSTELQQYNYFVMQEPVFESETKGPVYTHVYEEYGVLYCASSTSKGVYWYTYALNNPLIYTDPSGYMYDPAEHEPKGPLLLEGQKPIIWNSWTGYGGGQFAGCGFDYESLARAFNNMTSYRAPEAGAANTGGWEYNYGTGEYVNRNSGNTMSNIEFSYHFDESVTSNSYLVQIGSDVFFQNGEVYVRPVFGYKFNNLDLSSNYGSTWDPVTDQRIALLHPDVQGPARHFVNRVESDLGIKLRVTSGYRSFAEQNALYATGRTTPGSIVTNAIGGYSYHNYGLAFDVVEIANGQANWNTNWSAISDVGISIGFEWGGNFTGFADKPHFQMTFGYSISQLLNLYNSGKW